MIKIPVSQTIDVYDEVWRYLDANCIPAGVLAGWSPDRDKRMYSLMNNYDKVWNVTLYPNYVEVHAHPTEHETYLALKYGVVWSLYRYALVQV